MSEKLRVNSKTESLRRKIECEWEEFVSELKSLPVEEVIGKAYEIHWKETIKDVILHTEYTFGETFAMLKSRNLLAEMYDEWLGYEDSCNDEIMHIIENRAQRMSGG